MSSIKIFISHSSVDKEIVDEFIDDVLKLSFHLSGDEIAYTSREDLGVKPGCNIKDFIKCNIEYADVVFLMISENYKKSEVCLNEMGAAWALGKSVISIILPESSFKQLGWLTTFDKAMKIDNPDSLDALYDRLCKLFGTNSNTAEWNRNKNKFLSYCQNYVPQEALTEDKTCQKHIGSSLLAFDYNYFVRGVEEGVYQFQIDVRFRANKTDVTIRKIELCNKYCFTGNSLNEKDSTPLNYCVLQNEIGIREIDVDDYESFVREKYQACKLKIIDFDIRKNEQKSISFHGCIYTIRQMDGYDDLPRNHWFLRIYYNIDDVHLIPLEMIIIKGKYNYYSG